MAGRTARAHHAFGRDRADDAADQGWQGMEGMLSVSQREIAQLHRQRREGLLPLLWMRRAWRCHSLDDRPAWSDLHGRCGGTGSGGRHGDARARSAHGSCCRTARRAARRDVCGAAMVCGAIGQRRGPARARLSGKTRPRCPHHSPIRLWLRAGRAAGAEGRFAAIS